MPAPAIKLSRDAILADLADFEADHATGLALDPKLQKAWAGRLGLYMEYARSAEPDGGWSGPLLEMLLGFAGFFVAIADASGKLSVLGLFLGFLGFASSTGKYTDAKLRAAEMLALQKQIEEAQIILQALRAARSNP